MKKLKFYLVLLGILLSSTLFAQQDGTAERPVFAEDLIVQGSACVGSDCVNGESFGFDTIRLKENNLRINFDDTSASASFPANDWRIAINDTSNGGANYFAVQDATANTTPFTVSAGSGNNALYISATGGNVGLGTATPIVELHVTDGDSPTIRIEQDGANGWTPQIWDVAGNETNFFIRDVTNGSLLPFKIKPGAPTGSLFVAANGNIGLGDETPSEKLDVNGNASIIGNTYIGGQAGVATITPDANASLDLAATDKGLLLNRLDNAGRIALGDALTTAATGAGMMIYDTEDAQTYFWNGTSWVNPAEDNQNLASASLTDTTLNIAIEDGTSVDVDLAAILVPLQTAVLDLEAENATQQSQIVAQQAQIDDLITRMETLEACACDALTVDEFEEASAKGIVLEQNVPNPFNGVTTIGYIIPTKYKSAYIKVVSSLGQVIYDIPITKFGKGSISVKKESLQSAIYFYSLYVDGDKVATKRLVVK
jgi:hypothetical protein